MREVPGPSSRATLPYSCYVDPDVLSVEREHVFGRHWQYVGHTGILPEPGMAAAAMAGFGPLLLTRDAEGVLRAFHNHCRHRGAQLLDGCIQRSTIQCPYHGWTYALDGRLNAAPRSAGEPDFDPAALGLHALAVETWGPFIFVHPDPLARPLDETLGPLPVQVESAGVDVQRLRHHSRVDSRLEANWKICCENFLECYHCQVAHPGLVEVLDVSEVSYRLDQKGLIFSQYGPLKGNRGAKFDPRGEVGAAQFHFVFPNVTVNIAPGRPNLSIGPILPDGPGRTVRFLDYFFHPDVDVGWIEEYLEWDRQVGVEDTALVERVQRGIAPRPRERGTLFRSENLIAAFDARLWTALDGYGLSGSTSTRG